MSEKVASKNLSYSSKIPPFLAALHAQAAGNRGPNPLAAAQRRFGKPRSSSEDAEDAPLVVDEHGNALEVILDQDGAVKPPAASTEGTATTQGKGPADEVKTEKQEAQAVDANFAIGGRKRKAGKVVGGADEKAVHRSARQEGDKSVKKPAPSQATKKAKKIKLSFEDDQG